MMERLGAERPRQPGLSPSHDAAGRSEPMSPAKMRFVIALSLVLGMATTINVLGRGNAGLGSAGVAIQPVNLDEPVWSTNRKEVVNGLPNGRLGAIRRELMARGYLDKAGDAPIDARTRAGILAFEYDHALTLTATPSDALLKSLIFEVATSAETSGSRGMTSDAVALIRDVQRALERVGFLKAGVTGRIDGATRSAIRAFERARGMESTGRVSAALVDSLGPAFATR